MSKERKLKRMRPKKVQEIEVKEQKNMRNTPLIFSGIILAMISIGLLIFVLSEKVFHLN